LEQLEVALRRALELEPASSRHKARLAALLMQRGKRAEATGLYAEFVTPTSDDPIALNNAAMLLGEQPATRDEAVKLAERAKELMPDNPAILDTLGWALVRRGATRDLARASALLNQAATRLPTPEVTFHLGAAKLAAGDTSEGQKLIRRALAESKAEQWHAEAEQWLAMPAVVAPTP
jgi:Flp pilus assembly protein TadD